MTDPSAPLRTRTPASWAPRVLTEPVALLDDHAHLEQAAAANALALIRRRPDRVPADRWVERLTSVTQDEVAHLSLVHRELTRRGGELSRAHRNSYAAGLRRHVRAGDGAWDLVDRLLVSAIIELRSYERFVALAAADHGLSPLYAGLRDSEAGHHRLFLQLAEAAAPQLDVDARWREWLDLEAEVLADQPPGPRIHSAP